MRLRRIAVRCRLTTRAVIATGLAISLVILSEAPVSAQQAKCLSGKTLCMSKKTAGMLKCEALAATPGKPVDANANDCLTKVAAKWDGGGNPAKGCFERLENKPTNDCLTVDDAGPVGAAIDDCVAALVAAIDAPPLDQTKCGTGKRRCVSKYVGALLKCRRSAQTPGKPVDPNVNGCVDKAVAKLTGGANPAKGCFARLEAHAPNDCQFTGDASAVQAVADDCTADLGVVPTCGDGNLDPGETCDGADDGNCPGDCTSDCGCASCFDHIAVDYPEACFAYSGFITAPSCRACCDADPVCHTACISAAAYGCIQQSPTHDCAFNVNFAGCAAECCGVL